MRLLIAGGIAKSLVRFRGPLLRTLVAAGHDVHTCAGEPEEGVSRELVGLGVRFHAVPLARSGANPASDLRYSAAVAGVIRRVRPDLVLSYTLKPSIFASLASRAAGIRSASMITGAGRALAPSHGSKEVVISAVTRALLRLSLSTNEVVFFQNPDDIDEFVGRKLVSRTQCVLLEGSGVDLDHFTESSPPTDAPQFLLLSRLLREKGILDFARAARMLRARSGARFQLLGPREPGPRGLTSQDLDYCRECGVDYHGEVEDVRPYLNACSVYVLPSYYREGQPRSILEALATGRAVVTCDLPGCRETVIDGVNGFLVPPQQPAALAGALTRFVEQPSLIAAMGAESRRLAERRYDVHRVNATILKALQLVPPSGFLS